MKLSHPLLQAAIENANHNHDENHPTERHAFVDGAEWALELKLPLTFVVWVKSECFFNIKGHIIKALFNEGNRMEFELDELYDYWIDHVLPEAIKTMRENQ